MAHKSCPVVFAKLLLWLVPKLSQLKRTSGGMFLPIATHFSREPRSTLQTSQDMDEFVRPRAGNLDIWSWYSASHQCNAGNAASLPVTRVAHKCGLYLVAFPTELWGRHPEDTPRFSSMQCLELRPPSRSRIGLLLSSAITWAQHLQSQT